MTIQIQGSVQSQVLELIPRDYEVFGGLDVDHHSIAATFTDHQRLMQSLRLPYSARQLLNYVELLCALQSFEPFQNNYCLTLGEVFHVRIEHFGHSKRVRIQ